MGGSTRAPRVGVRALRIRNVAPAYPTGGRTVSSPNAFPAPRPGARSPRTVLAPWAFGLALVLAWYAAVWVAQVPSFLLPTPHAVLLRLVANAADASVWGYIGATAAEAVGGCLLGAAVALPLAIGIHRNRWVNAALVPFLGATQAIPAIAIAPLLVLWVGYGLGAVVLLCTLLVFFPILVSAVVGLRHVDASVLDAARMDGAGSWALLRHVELPLALPSVLAGLRNGFTLSVTGAVVGEMVMGGSGLGQLLTVQRDSLDTAGMFATIVVLGAMASAAYTAIHLVERRSRVMQSLRAS